MAMADANRLQENSFYQMHDYGAVFDAKIGQQPMMQMEKPIEAYPMLEQKAEVVESAPDKEVSAFEQP